MNEDRRPYRVNGKDVVVNADNVNYGNTNVEEVLDDVIGRVEDLEEGGGSGGGDDAAAEFVYTEDDCTVENTAIYINGTVSTNNNYNSTDYIEIPTDKKLKMYVKCNYNLDVYGIYFYTMRSGPTAFLSAIGGVGPYSGWTEVTIPERAYAIRFSAKKGHHISIKFVEQPVADTPSVKLKVAAWNIGGLSLGSDYSNITDANADAKRAAYRKVFDNVNADILCISEYSVQFNTSPAPNTLTKDEIFCNYPYYKLGYKESYNCNCVFSKFPILASREIGYTVKDMNRYLKEVTLKLNGKIVKVVTTHLSEEPTDGAYAHQVNKGIDQMGQLIDLYANDPYVIIGADFNIHITDTIGDYVDGSGTDGYNNYKYLTDAGYTLLRFDYLDHSMLVNPLSASTADNIAVKGFAMGQREFIYEQGVSENLSDHCMIACELVML